MQLAQCDALTGQAYPRLSGGEKQRVHLARCLLQLSQAEQPPLLLLDEPTSAQDLGQQHSLLQRVRKLCEQEQYAVVAVLHDLNQALRYANQASLLDAGRLVGEGCPESLLTPERVQMFWGYPAERVINQSGRTVLV
jgi:iron complex transport system ATP-binding protein